MFTTEEIFRKKSHSVDGVQVDRQMMSVPMKEIVKMLAGAELKLLLSVFYEELDEDYCIRLSNKEIAELTGISERSINTYVKLLEETEYKGIPLIRKLEGTGRQSNLYWVINIK